MTDPVSLPSVSIVIPVRNEASTIAATLDSCLDQTYDGEMEIVVADAMSTDGTREIVEGYGRHHRVVLIDNSALVTPAGLNEAISHARGDVIVRCDAHSILPTTYVATAVRILLETGAANVGGVQRAVGTTAVQRGIAAAMTNVLGVGNAQFHSGGTAGPTDTVYLGVFDRRVLDEVGGFDETLLRNQDYELNVRLRAADYDVWFDDTLEVEYTPRRSFAGLWKQYNDYGRWKRVVARMHPASLKARQAAPPILVVGLAGSIALLVTPGRKLGVATLLGYASALTLAGVYEAVRTKDPAGLLAAPAIGTMHIAWGVGFLLGAEEQRTPGQLS